jgi:hypothetical protein
MSDRLVIGGKLTDLQDPKQLGRLNDILAQLCAITNAFDQNSFALAWIDGDVAGKVIASKGTGVAPEWDASPPLTGLRLSGLSASQLVATNGSKDLVSDPKTYVQGAASYRLFVSATEPPAPHQVNDIWIDTSV